MTNAVERPSLHHQVNAWREVGEEVERILDFLPASKRDDLCPDWFIPRLRELLASQVGEAIPPPAQEPKDMRFRKKPVVIEAFQWQGDFDALDAWLNSLGLQEDGEDDSSADGIHESDTEDHVLVIPTEEGEHRAQKGDWIIRGVMGEFYPCKPDIFEATYESADSPAGATEATPQPNPLLEAAKALLAKESLQYGRHRIDQAFCTSCGAMKFVDYEETVTHEHIEPCSRTCLWRLLRDAVAAAPFSSDAPPKEKK